MSDIIPVFLGADLNCYNFARAFHEAYGVESYAYGRYPMAPTKYSKIIHFTTVPDMDNEDTMLRILHEFAAQHKGKRLYLFGCTDDYAAMIIRRKAELTEQQTFLDYFAKLGTVLPKIPNCAEIQRYSTLILTDKQHEIVDKCFDTLYDCVYNDKSV